MQNRWRPIIESHLNLEGLYLAAAPSALVELLSYYRLVLALLFLLCLFWCLVHVNAVWARVRRARSGSVGVLVDVTTRRDLKDLIEYVNANFPWVDDKGDTAKRRKADVTRRRLASEERIFAFYFHHHKILKRIPDLFLSLLIIGFAINYAGGFAAVVIGIFAAGYFAAAWRDEGYLQRLCEFPVLVFHILLFARSDADLVRAEPAPAKGRGA